MPCGRRSTPHHAWYRAVPRTNRTLVTANTHIHSATSITSAPPSDARVPPWQCSCADASPGECSDVATPGNQILSMGLRFTRSPGIGQIEIRGRGIWRMRDGLPARKAQPPKQRPTIGTQTPEQHIAPLVHGWLLCKHEAAWAGMGATMEVTRGKAIAAAKPILRTATRRERYSTGTFDSTSRLAFANWSRASRTTDSSTRADSCLESVLVICDGLLLPSHSFQVAAAVEFKQWPTSRCRS